MCGKFALFSSLNEIRAYLNSICTISEWHSSHEIFPGNDVPAFVHFKNQFRLGKLNWSFRPKWAKKKSDKFINTRAETINSKISFSESFQTRRCIIPANGYYEWDKDKNQYFFSVKDKEIISFPGIFIKWKNDSNEEIFTFSIITKNSEDSIKEIHHRQPVIFTKNQAKEWLQSKNTTHLKKLLLKKTENKITYNLRIS